MGGSTLGSIFQVTTFGESHGTAVGVVIEGCPSNLPLTPNIIQTELNKRKSLQKNSVCDETPAYLASWKDFSTERAEDDYCEILSGVFNGRTLGTPITIIIRNNNIISKDYENIKDVYRPGHADFVYEKKYGIRDYRGGGRASGRETAARVAAGAVAQCVLNFFLHKQNTHPIQIKTWADEICGIPVDTPLYPESTLPYPILEALNKIKAEGESAGALIACEINNVPAGLGEPVFSKLEAAFAASMLSIGGIKGIEFGAGFKSAAMTGSQHNKQGKNCNGGIIGGISTGEPICFRLAVKPVPSVKKMQKALNSKGETVDLSITGRHDICLFPRIVPVIEAMAFITLADAFLFQMKQFRE